VHESCWEAEYMSHNIVIGSVVAALPQAQHRAAPPLRAAPQRVRPLVPATVLAPKRRRCCAPVPPRVSAPSAPPCSLPRPIRYCATYIRLARLAPVTPPAFPTSQLNEDGRAKGMFAASRGARRRRWRAAWNRGGRHEQIECSFPRSTSPVVRRKRRLLKWRA
jgi:hypothetical protein